MLSKYVVVFIYILVLLYSIYHYNYFYLLCESRNTPAIQMTALILARGGSKSIKLKNLVKIGDNTLLKRSLDVIKQANVFDAVWVSTDHPDIAREAKIGGAMVHNRSSESATDKATSILAVEEFLQHHEEIRGILALIQCTSPLIKKEYLLAAVEGVRAGKPCMFSVTRSFKLRWKFDEAGNVHPLNFDPNNRPRRQDWKGELVENGMFYFADRTLLEKGIFQNDRCGVVAVDERDSIEVDEVWHAQLVEALEGVQRRGSGATVMEAATSDSVPSFYRETFDAFSLNGGTITRNAFQVILKHSGLEAMQMDRIWEFSGPDGEPLTKNSFYKCLALIAWAQLGKDLSGKLLDNFPGQELPIPVISNFAHIKTMLRNESVSDASNLNVTYKDMKNLDTISIDRVPERIGIILKHSEYLVTSQRFKTAVRRRYNDFLALQDLLLARFPYRLIPRLPPKKIIVSEDAHFLEERRKGLRRWINLIARHPIIACDALVAYFLQNQGQDIQHKIKELFKRVPDEFMTSELSARSKRDICDSAKLNNCNRASNLAVCDQSPYELVPPETSTEFSSSREQIRMISLGVSKLKQIFDLGAARNEAFVNSMQELGNQLSALGNEPLPHSEWAAGNNTTWQKTKKGFSNISKEFNSLSMKASSHTVIFEEKVLHGIACVLDILQAHNDMCERLEKGVLNDHNAALNKMMALKKRRMKGVIKGQDMESIDALEQRMLEQEAAITSLELRHSFSLYCAQMETRLVHLHLAHLAAVFNSFVMVNLQSHSEMLELWKQIHPTVAKFLPNEEDSSNGFI